MKPFVVFDKYGDWINDFNSLEAAETFSLAYASNAPERDPVSIFRKCAVIETVPDVTVSYE